MIDRDSYLLNVEDYIHVECLYFNLFYLVCDFSCMAYKDKCN